MIMLQKVSGKKDETESKKAEKEDTDKTDNVTRRNRGNTGYRDPVTGRMVR